MKWSLLLFLGACFLADPYIPFPHLPESLRAFLKLFCLLFSPPSVGLFLGARLAYFFIKKDLDRSLVETQRIYALFVIEALILILKFFIQRERPHDGGLFDSFPSSHAATLMMVALFFGKSKSLALVCSASRFLLGAHYLSDIAAGSLIAYFLTPWLCQKKITS